MGRKAIYAGFWITNGWLRDQFGGVKVKNPLTTSIQEFLDQSTDLSKTLYDYFKSFNESYENYRIGNPDPDQSDTLWKNLGSMNLADCFDPRITIGVSYGAGNPT